MSRRYVNIVLNGDKNYVMPMTVTMTSILANLNRDFTARFFLFVEGFDDADLAKVSEVRSLADCEIVPIPMDEHRHHFAAIDPATFVLQYVSLATYYRLLMMEILPNDVDLCFYVDGDMIVDGDLSKLLAVMDEDALAAAVVDVHSMRHRHRILRHCYEFAEFAPFAENPMAAPYFNAGFYLLNVAAAKRLDCFADCMRFLRNHPNPPYADQDTLNAVLGQKHRDRLRLLPFSWNVFCDIDFSDDYPDVYYPANDIRRGAESPNIYHFAGGNKPWLNERILHFHEKWWQYCRLSPFKDIPQRKNAPGRPPSTERREFHLARLERSPGTRRLVLFNNLTFLEAAKRDGKIDVTLFGRLPVYRIAMEPQRNRHFLLGIPFLTTRITNQTRWAEHPDVATIDQTAAKNAPYPLRDKVE